jgi:hypothetical protein
LGATPDKEQKMVCFIHKWFVSSALDTGKPLPGLVRKHLKNCNECHAFAASADHLHQQLDTDTPTFLSSFSHQKLQEKIVSGLPLRFPTTTKSRGSDDSIFKTGVFFLRPTIAAVLAIVILVTGVWWFNSQRNTSNTTQQAILNKVPPVINKAGDSLIKFAVNLESPLHQEAKSLKEAAKSTKEFFASYLNLKI